MTFLTARCLDNLSHNSLLKGSPPGTRDLATSCSTATASPQLALGTTSAKRGAIPGGNIRAFLPMCSRHRGLTHDGEPWVPSEHCDKHCLNFRVRLHTTRCETSCTWGLPTRVQPRLSATACWCSFSPALTLRPPEFPNKSNLTVLGSATFPCAHDAILQALPCGCQFGSVDLRTHLLRSTRERPRTR